MIGCHGKGRMREKLVPVKAEVSTTMTPDVRVRGMLGQPVVSPVEPPAVTAGAVDRLAYFLLPSVIQCVSGSTGASTVSSAEPLTTEVASKACHEGSSNGSP